MRALLFFVFVLGSGASAAQVSDAERARRERDQHQQRERATREREAAASRQRNAAERERSQNEWRRETAERREEMTLERQWQRTARNTYHALRDYDKSVPELRDVQYLAPDFIERAPLLRSYAILPARVSSYLFTVEGHYLTSFLSDSLAEVCAAITTKDLSEAFVSRLKRNAQPLALQEQAETSIKLRSLGSRLADTVDVRAAFAALGVDVILVPRVTVHGVGTKHAEDATKRGIQPDLISRIHIYEPFQGVFYSLEFVAYDRLSFSTTETPRPLWRSMIAHEVMLGYAVGGGNLVKRVRPSMLYIASNELARFHALLIPLHDGNFQKIVKEKAASKQKAD